MATSQPHDIDAGAVREVAILGAFKLHLDFINLFLMLLRIFGGGREKQKVREFRWLDYRALSSLNIFMEGRN